ncbi:MAG: tail fiber domain-containing protein [Phycisphaerales bacterium]|nr:tail fiber domain-containing protein [Phycisphaerales bacterium]
MIYPSTINVTGGPASISYVTVQLKNFSHTWANDVNVLLVSPAGQKILLMANTNGSGDASNANLIFASDATQTLPGFTAPVVSGVYACSVYSVPSSLPAPAPAGPYLTSLSPLLGTNANGTWSLYVLDDFPSGDDGTFDGGWAISFDQAPPQTVTTAFTYQGVLTASGVPINGNANVRFTLCNDPSRPLNISDIAPAITRSFTAISSGRVTTTLDFASAIDTDQALWLNIEVESPPGSGFVTLSPRQPITPVPQARTAQIATLALTASTATQLAAGRQRIRGDTGTTSNSPGIWFASPAFNPTDRAFVGMRDDNNVGFFINGDWRLRANANGNIAIGDGSGVAPPERLTITGNAQLNTSTTSVPSKLAFGTVGDEGSGAENTDAVYFSRINAGTDLTELRLVIGDNSGPNDLDSLRICTTSVSGILTERFRFQSDGQALKPGGGSWAALSDPRAKHDIAPLTGTLDKLMSLRGYSFLYNDDRVASGQALPGTQFGLMADEVARVFPDWVSTDATGTRFVTERATTALMVEALRDLRREKDEVAAQASADRREVEALKAEVAQLKSLINQLARERADQPK